MPSGSRACAPRWGCGQAAAHRPVRWARPGPCASCRQTAHRKFPRVRPSCRCARAGRCPRAAARCIPLRARRSAPAGRSARPPPALDSPAPWQTRRIQSPYTGPPPGARNHCRAFPRRPAGPRRAFAPCRCPFSRRRAQRAFAAFRPAPRCRPDTAAAGSPPPAGCGIFPAAGCAAGSRGRKSPWSPHRRPRTPRAPAADTRARKSPEYRRGAKTGPVLRPVPCADSRSAAAHPRRPRAGGSCRRGSQRPPAAVFPSAWRAAADRKPCTPRPAPYRQRARKARSGAFAPPGARRSRPCKTYSRAPSAAAHPAPAGRRGLFETARPPPRPGTRPAPARRAARASTPPAARAHSPAGPKCAQEAARSPTMPGGRLLPYRRTVVRPARPRTRQHLLYVKNRVFLSYHNLHRKSKSHARQILYLIYIIIIYIIVEIIMNFCYTDRADTGASAQ